MINAAFIYVAPGQNPQEQKAVIPSDTLTLHVVGCSTYDQAETAAKELVANGCGAIESVSYTHLTLPTKRIV